MLTFAAHQVGVLASSGWATSPSVANAVENAGLPPVTATYLQETFTADHWRSAQDAVNALLRHFGAARFADEVTYGVLLVPDPARLDTRAAVDPSTRLDQLGTASADVVDPRLPAGRLGVRPGPAWTLIATVTGAYGPALGSHHDITRAPPDRFTVSGLDTRQLMIRQLWGARVLQGGRQLPDYDGNQRWTFTLFPGEGLTDGHAESGTVLKSRVRFRLGKPDRGIGPARVAPALPVP